VKGGDEMRTVAEALFWVAAVAAALFPVSAEALIAANHSETLVRDR
jgi:membrane protein YqaA with SNARE-associated domain